MSSGSMHASGRAAALSRALRQAARSFRAAGTAATARGNVVLVQRRWDGVFGPALKISFAVIVGAPVLMAALYFGFIASDRFVATTQFTLRSGQQTDILMGGLEALIQQPTQNTNVVANYISSNDMVTALDHQIGLRKIYDRPEADYFSRISTTRPMEEFNRYWNRHIDVEVDDNSNIVTVSVNAFTPQDALRVASGILTQSERLVNEMSERARTDALRNSLTELAGLERELDARTHAVRVLRDQSGLIDPKITSDVSAKMLGDMRTSLSDLKIEYSSLLRYVSPDAPQVKMLTHRIADTEAQIAALERQMAGASQASNPTLAASSALFDKANLDLSVAQEQYAGGVLAMEKARTELEDKLVYVLPFEQPTLAEKALYPRRWLDIGIVAAICLAIWATLAGLAVIARNNLAV